MRDAAGLPEAFAERMRGLLGSEYKDFEAEYGRERHYGLRRNLLKGTEEEFIKRMPFSLKPVLWAREGYYYEAGDRPGRHVLHEAGAYYIQEPSAMAVVEVLDPKPGERVLDLCAAPGGKATQIAGRMQGRGFLLANETVGERAKILSQNVERMGVCNCVVCSEKPERLSAFFPAFFDRILVDAPCSGEGMFRKEDAARAEWSLENVRMCADRQAMILREADKMLKPGGVLVYSTCTFSPEENEGTISAFLRAHESYYIEETELEVVFSPGRAEWVKEPAVGIEHTLRLWPHLLCGEGHFVARLRKESEGEKESGKERRRVSPADNKLCKLVEEVFMKELGIGDGWRARHPGRIIRFGEQIYLMPEDMVSMAGLKVLRPGLQLLSERKNRFEPAHALSRTLLSEDTEKFKEMSLQEAEAYLRGESLGQEEQKGWIVLNYRGYPLGFGKASGGQIKNHYPKGIRRAFPNS